MMQVFQYSAIQEEKPYKGYRIQKVLSRASKVTDFEAYLCECEGKRVILAASLIVAKRTIDARECTEKEGLRENENKAP